MLSYDYFMCLLACLYTFHAYFIKIILALLPKELDLPKTKPHNLYTLKPHNLYTLKPHNPYTLKPPK